MMIMIRITEETIMQKTQEAEKQLLCHSRKLFLYLQLTVKPFHNGKIVGYESIQSIMVEQEKKLCRGCYLCEHVYVCV